MEGCDPSEMPDLDPWDLDRLLLPAERTGEPMPRKQLPRHRPGEAFLRGPIPFAWISAACRLPGIGLHVALSLRFLRDRFRRGRDRRWTLDCLSQGLQVSQASVRRGLRVGEGAGLFSISRKPGCKILVADVTIFEVPDAEGEMDRRPL